MKMLFISTFNLKGDVLIPSFPYNQELANFNLLRNISSHIMIRPLIFIDFLIKLKLKSNPINFMMLSPSQQKNKINYLSKGRMNFQFIKSNIK